MQWPHFFEGKLLTNAARGEFVPISRGYGFLWLFIAGVPWAGIGACLLAWCGASRETRAWHWALRIACGLGGAALARHLFDTYPQFFLPLYDSLEPRYHDLTANPTLRRLINDCGTAVVHMGYYLGFLTYEVGRREGKNVVLILTVGLVNGAGWALCQNWKWAPGFWQGSHFNFWRCWESSGGISIGVAYGIAYYLVNRATPREERERLASRRGIAGPNLEWLLVYLGLAGLLGWFMSEDLGGWGNLDFGVVMLFGVAYFSRNRRTPTTEWSDGDPNLDRWGLSLGVLTGLGLSVRNGLKGCLSIYLGNEALWGRRLWEILGPIELACLVALALWILFRPCARAPGARRFPRAYGLIWLVLIVQNVIAQMVTGPPNQWNEMAFSIYYVLLFLLSAIIVFHVHVLRERTC